MVARKIIKWMFIVVLTVAVAIYVAVMAAVWKSQDQLMFGRRTNEIVEDPSARNWPYEDVWVEAGGGKTHGWWIPLQDARGVVLFSHGNGRNVSGYLEDAALFRELGFSVLLYDYGGYGLSSGEPSEARCYADARAMWDWLVQVKQIPAEKIVLDGSSMGGGVTSELATQVAPAAVVLESTFTSIPDIISDTYPFIPANLLFHIRFRNIDKVGRIGKAVLVVHSKDDKTVPFEQGRQLFEHIKTPKEFVEIQGAHHGGKFDSREIYSAGLKAFLAKHVP